ncbi:hypothetical protein J2T12_000040 [Paenibacillus anaericanus]|nr:hypothetical protein [Paenibacillus anaericanus]
MLKGQPLSLLYTLQRDTVHLPLDHGLSIIISQGRS